MLVGTFTVRITVPNVEVSGNITHGLIEAGVVEQIKELETNTKIGMFRKFCVFHEGEVSVKETRTTELIPCLIHNHARVCEANPPEHSNMVELLPDVGSGMVLPFPQLPFVVGPTTLANIVTP